MRLVRTSGGREGRGGEGRGGEGVSVTTVATFTTCVQYYVVMGGK